MLYSYTVALFTDGLRDALFFPSNTTSESVHPNILWTLKKDQPKISYMALIKRLQHFFSLEFAYHQTIGSHSLQ